MVVMGGYQCSKTSRCPCPPGRVVSRVTAFRHYREAIRLERRLHPRLPRIVSPPRAVETCFGYSKEDSRNFSECLVGGSSAVDLKGSDSEAAPKQETNTQDSGSCSCSSSSSSRSVQILDCLQSNCREEDDPNCSVDIDVADESSNSNFLQSSGTGFPGQSEEDRLQHLKLSPVRGDEAQRKSESRRDPHPEHHGESITHSSSSHNTKSSCEIVLNDTRSPDSDGFSVSHSEESESDDGPPFDVRPSHLHTFVQEHGFLISFALKHGTVTSEMMNDLLVERGAFYTSWGGVRAALIREALPQIQMFPHCSEGHMALISNELKVMKQCLHPRCTRDPCSISFFSYIPIEDRIRTHLKSKSCGPSLYSYYQKRLSESLQRGGQQRFVDFTSGRIFKEAVRELGGMEAVKYDILVALSTDGVNAFRKTQYSYWPVVLTILNIAPSERFKVKNMLPVSVIPGPNAPTNLNSFLSPLFMELENLSQGIDVAMWDGRQRKVRVHLLYVMGDLAALKKLTNLKGYNALVPCRFCLIRGRYMSERRHVYYPPFVHENQDGLESIRKFWDPNRLPLRTPEGYRSSVSDLQTRIGSLTSTELGRRCQNIGIESPSMCEIVRRMKFVEPFHGFQIDLMHLLFENIAPDMMSLWCGDSVNLADISVLSAKRTQTEVSNRLTSAGSSVSDRIRRPRELEKRNRWKATEWKAFVMELSLIVLDGLLPSEMLSGWSYFVDLCRILSNWEHSNADVKQIGYLSKKIYAHFVSVYYKGDPKRIFVCKYIYHLLLHLEESVRACGPLSYLSQWCVENYVGTQNRRCNATFKFAESVMEKLKLVEATKMFCSQHDITLPFSDDPRSQVRSSLVRESSNPNLEGYCFRHPKKVLKLGDPSRVLGLNIRLLLDEYYTRTSRSEYLAQVHDDNNLVIWKRMSVEKADDGYYTTYSAASYDPPREGSRSYCYVTGIFEGDAEQKIDFYYGKVLLFFEHGNVGPHELLCLFAWAGSGLKRGRQKQVFKNGFDSDGQVFGDYSVESGATISRQISIVEQRVQVKGRRKLQKRTYFVDSLRDTWIERKPEEGDTYRLRGLER